MLWGTPEAFRVSLCHSEQSYRIATSGESGVYTMQVGSRESSAGDVRVELDYMAQDWYWCLALVKTIMNHRVQ
jgi:hypothetical protein